MKSSDPDAERWILYGAVIALLERASSDATVVLLLDDLHWADRPTLQLLRHITTSLVGNVVVLGTYRDTQLSSSHPLTETLAALTREPSVTRIALSGLGDDEVVAFVEAAAGQSLDERATELAHALYRETDGNPFFVAEVLRHLVESRAIVQDDTGRWIPAQELSEAGLPESVRQVIGSRVARLGDEAIRVLSAASVLGLEFDVGLLAAVVGSGDDPGAGRSRGRGLSSTDHRGTSVPGRFRFAHALIQHTLYEDLSATVGPACTVRLRRPSSDRRRESGSPGRRVGPALAGRDSPDRVVEGGDLRPTRRRERPRVIGTGRGDPLVRRGHTALAHDPDGRNGRRASPVLAMRNGRSATGPIERPSSKPLVSLRLLVMWTRSSRQHSPTTAAFRAGLESSTPSGYTCSPLPSTRWVPPTVLHAAGCCIAGSRTHL